MTSTVASDPIADAILAGIEDACASYQRWTTVKASDITDSTLHFLRPWHVPEVVISTCVLQKLEGAVLSRGFNFCPEYSVKKFDSLTVGKKPKWLPKKLRGNGRFDVAVFKNEGADKPFSGRFRPYTFIEVKKHVWTQNKLAPDFDRVVQALKRWECLDRAYLAGPVVSYGKDTNVERNVTKWQSDGVEKAKYHVKIIHSPQPARSDPWNEEEQHHKWCPVVFTIARV